MSQGIDALAAMAAEMIERGIRRVHVLGWRDLDDPDAGGSEVHADEFMRRWAAVGFDIVHRTSAAAGHPAIASRNGYRVIRRGSRHSVFPRTVAAELTRSMGRRDALVEIWNGVPWFSPIWCRTPRITMLHHIHGPMWDQILPGPLAAFGRTLEARWAPPWYRRTRVVTPSEATRDELLGLGFRPALVTAVPNGVDGAFHPGGRKAPVPTVVVVGRLAPVKRQELAIAAAVAAKATVADLRLRIVGSGPAHDRLAALVEHHGAGQWIDLVGAVSRQQLIDEYRSAWVALSASLAEGWGLTLTEAAACGTPAVASDIAGHRCSVRHGSTGLLATPDRLGDALTDVLTDHRLRSRLERGALDWARTLTWDASATGLLRALYDEATPAPRAIGAGG